MEYDPTAQYAKKKRRSEYNRTIPPKKQRLYEDEEDFVNDPASRKLLKYSRLVLSEVNDDTDKISASERAHLILNLNLIIDKLLFPKEQVQLLPEGSYPPIAFEKNLMWEIVALQLISLEEAKRRFDFFIHSMLPYYPIVSLSSKLKDFNYLYQNHPLLLGACISVTAVNDNELSDENLSSSYVYNMLTHYLYNFISFHIHIKCEDFNIQLIYVCQVLSAWCLPPHKVGHFKNQVNTLLAFTVSLCMDLSKSSETTGHNEEYRNNLRALLSVYCTCGSLQLALRRFKLVSWDDTLSNAVQYLMKPSRQSNYEDRFLCYFAKLISVGQEVMNFLMSQVDNLLVDRSGAGNTQGFHVTNVQFKYLLNTYEQKLQLILTEYEEKARNKDTKLLYPKELDILSISYYQLVVMMYDTLISRFLNTTRTNTPSAVIFQSTEKELFLQLVFKLVESCENMINTFVNLNQETINFPTVLYYRPMTALVTMIKVRLALKAKMDNTDEAIGEDVDIDIEKYFATISKLISVNLNTYNLVVCEKMSFILTKIEKWMKVSKIYKLKTDKPEHNDLVHIISKSNNKEIESLSVPKVYEEVSDSMKSSAPTTMSENAIDTMFLDNDINIDEFFGLLNGDVFSYINTSPTDFSISNI